MNSEGTSRGNRQKFFEEFAKPKLYFRVKPLPHFNTKKDIQRKCGKLLKSCT